MHPHAPSSSKQSSSRLPEHQQLRPPAAHSLTERPAPSGRARKQSRGAMEYGYPYNGCGGNKEKRPPLKRGQLKLQIARTLLGGLVVPAGSKNRDRSFGR
uniref:Uncharacterized protein n=1 Tax=Setaria italica TaxID=4555 RepID=K3XNJ6_SETIT